MADAQGGISVIKCNHHWALVAREGQGKMNLREALRLNRDARMAVVGAGGKTTALFQLAREFDGPVLVTSSTHLGTWQAAFADRHWMITRADDVERFAGQIEGVTLFTGAPGEDERLAGLDEESLAAVNALAGRLGFPVLVEADGSRQKPLKAPGAHEPAIPGWVKQVLVVAGLSGLGRPLDDQNVHRAERFAALAGMALGEPVREAHLLRVLVSEEGGRKAVPPGARVSLLLNQADEVERLSAALRIAREARSFYASVIIASLSEKQLWMVDESTAGVVLAAGGASRFGEPKVLLPWRGKPLVRHAAESALAAGLWPVVVVAGEGAEAVRGALAGLGVQVVENPRWQAGQSTSLHAGLQALDEECGAAVFLLGDQPLVTVDVIQALLDRHAQTLAAAVVPRVEGRRANPVLFDRRAFPALLAVEGDTGGRAVLDRYPVEYVDWPDANLLFDVDTPGDYQKLMEME